MANSLQGDPQREERQLLSDHAGAASFRLVV